MKIATFYIIAKIQSKGAFGKFNNRMWKISKLAEYN